MAPATSTPPVGLTAACPASYLPPDPHRPQVTLTFTWRRSPHRDRPRAGASSLPIAPSRELVYRLWPNGSDHRLGGSLTVTKAQIAGQPVAFQPAAAVGGRERRAPCCRCRWADRRRGCSRSPPTSTSRFGSRRPSSTGWAPTDIRPGGGPASRCSLGCRARAGCVPRGARTLAEMAVSEAASTDVTVIAPDRRHRAGQRHAEPAGGRLRDPAQLALQRPDARDVVVAAGRAGVVTAQRADPAARSRSGSASRPA